jgi:hypothetical protein
VISILALVTSDKPPGAAEATGTAEAARTAGSAQSPLPDSDDLSVGFLLGLLVGEGHFGGDGRQPQVTLRMHVRHEETFEWLRRTYPGSALYGPYHHGGRSYYQWAARGRYLREYIVPLVQRHRSLLDAYTAARFDTMCERYTITRETTAAASDA